MTHQAYKFRHLFSLKGRVSRNSFVFAVFIFGLATVFLSFIAMLILFAEPVSRLSFIDEQLVVKNLVVNGILLSFFALIISVLSIHRLHDLNIPAWYFFGFVNINVAALTTLYFASHYATESLAEICYWLAVGIVWTTIGAFAILSLLKGNASENLYGPSRSFLIGWASAAARIFVLLLSLLFLAVIVLYRFNFPEPVWLTIGKAILPLVILYLVIEDKK